MKQKGEDREPFRNLLDRITTNEFDKKKIDYTTYQTLQKNAFSMKFDKDITLELEVSKKKIEVLKKKGFSFNIFFQKLSLKNQYFSNS